jgi:hypothetical protein
MGRDPISLLSLDLDTFLKFICRLRIEVNVGTGAKRKTKKNFDSYGESGGPFIAILELLYPFPESNPYFIS